jgi:predicted TIM-barrel fold metal-dependent hydrolase
MRFERIISADSHLGLRDEDVLAHLPRKFHDGYREAKAAYLARLGARPVRQDDRQDPSSGADAPSREERRHEAQGRAGEFDPYERLKDMDIDGVSAEVLYSDVTGGAPFYDMAPDASLAAFQAFNSAAIDFASVDPKRLLPVYIVPLADVQAAVKEIERVASEGARAILFPLYPTELGLPPYHELRYDPVWAAVQEIGIPISQHVNTNTALNEIKALDPTPTKGLFQSLPPIAMAQSVGSWILLGMLDRFPGLRIVFVESGLGWLPYYLRRLDEMRHRHRWHEMKELPSAYWRRQMLATFEDDEFGVANRYEIGVENIMWATDYPHPDTTWPHSREVIKKHFDGVAEDETALIVAGNAARVYAL